MRIVRYSVLCSSLLMMGCRDTLQGTWTGEFDCQDRTYDVIAQFVEDGRFEFDGEMLFSYDEQTTFGGESVVFHADLKYDFKTEQTAIVGDQNIYLDMVWTSLYCEIEYPDGEVVEGGCKNVGGIDDSDKGEPVGMVEMRYSGSDWMAIDDDNCKGELDLQ